MHDARGCRTSWGDTVIDAVFIFGAINIVFEFVILCMIPPKFRLRLLGSKAWSRAMHVTVMIIILIIHWGTLVGSMSGLFSFCLSMLTVELAKLVFGYITPDEKFHRRIIGYTTDELRWETD